VTLVEFLHPLRSSGRRDLVLATLYYYKKYESTPSMTVGAIRAALMQARAPRAKQMNISDVLAKASPFVYSRDKGNYSLTNTGVRYVREHVGESDAEPEMQHDASSLRRVASKIQDPVIRSYVEEAILCLEVGALRAAIVFLWTAAIRELHEKAWTEKGGAVINPAIKKQDSRARDVKKADDFAYIKDRNFLDATPDMGLLDKGQKDTLVEALNLRNRSGHPTQYKPGADKARSFIADVVGIVWA
jgi:hypothetical protein